MKNTKPKLPRRTRNHVNPLADLQEHNFEGFTNNNPIMVDIGSYKGEFVESLAHMMPEYNFLACEIRKPYAHYLRDLFVDTPHVEVFDGDSAKNFKGLVKHSQDKGVLIEYVFINFPDPWFKDKHKKRRVINQNFLKNIKTWVDPKTTFVFQTDQEKLFRETQELLRENEIKFSEFKEPLWGAQTHWELMKIKEADAIYRMVFSVV